MERGPVLYEIDRDDVITGVGGNWSDFASRNGGIGDVVGRPLWHFVHGSDVRAVWSLLVRHVRATGRPIRFAYRCDAPTVERLLQMEMRPAADGRITFVSSQLRSTPAPTVAGRWSPGAPVTVCGWCGRVRIGRAWEEPSRAAHLLGLTGDEGPRLSHGVCDACADELRAATRR